MRSAAVAFLSAGVMLLCTPATAADPSASKHQLARADLWMLRPMSAVPRAAALEHGPQQHQKYSIAADARKTTPPPDSIQRGATKGVDDSILDETLSQSEKQLLTDKVAEAKKVTIDLEGAEEDEAHQHREHNDGKQHHEVAEAKQVTLDLEGAEEDEVVHHAHPAIDARRAGRMQGRDSHIEQVDLMKPLKKLRKVDAADATKPSGASKLLQSGQKAADVEDTDEKEDTDLDEQIAEAERTDDR